MGTQSINLFGETRSALLALLYGHTDESFYQRQLIRAIGAGHGAIQRELKQLADMGLIVRKLQGNQVLYRANTKSPIFAEIKSLITKQPAPTMPSARLWRRWSRKSRSLLFLARLRGRRNGPGVTLI